TDTSGRRILDVVWAAAAAVPDWSLFASANLNDHLIDGGRLLAMDDNPLTIENTATVAYLTTTGLAGVTGFLSGRLCPGGFDNITRAAYDGADQTPTPASNPYHQIGDELLRTNSFFGGDRGFTFQVGSNFTPGVQGIVNTETNRYPIIDGHPTIAGVQR